MHERIERIRRVLRELDADWAVLTGPDTVCYATGHVVPIEWGPSPFGGGPSTALVGADGSVGLVAPNHELGSPPADVECAPYVGFAWESAADLVANHRDALLGLARKLGVGGTLAVEPASFPHATHEALGAMRAVSIDAALWRTRAIKTSGEIAALRRAAETAAIGQQAALLASRAGRHELEAFADIRCAMERFAGERCPLAGDYLSGIERTAGATGWPVERRIESGDPVICDLAPRVAGWWGDSCGSFAVGQPTDAFQALFDAAKGALDLAVATMRPGEPIADLDARLRGHVRAAGFEYAHHSGHSIGTLVHEQPRIVPHERTALAEDMVLMVEPSAYVPGVGGVRIEWMLHVTATGAVPLAPFEHVSSVPAMSPEESSEAPAA